MTQECGACGTHNKYVFCTECGIKLPDKTPAKKAVDNIRRIAAIDQGLRVVSVPDHKLMDPNFMHKLREAMDNLSLHDTVIFPREVMSEVIR